MKKFIPLIADALLAALCVFLLFFTLVRYYYSAAAGLAAGAVAAVAAGTGAFCLMKVRRSKSAAAGAVRADAENLAAHLAVAGECRGRALFAECVNGKICGDFIETDDGLYLLACTPEKAGAERLLPLITAETAKSRHFACAAGITPKCAEYAAAADIAVLGADGIYELFKKAGKLPQKYLLEGKKRTKFLSAVRSRFTKKLCLPAFWSGAALLFFSYFTYYPAYYMAFGSLLLALCAAAAIFGRKAA